MVVIYCSIGVGSFGYHRASTDTTIMPPRLQLLRSGQACFLRPLLSKPIRLLVPLRLRLAQQRYITADEKPLPEAEEQEPGPNQEQLPHVSEEAAATGKITGEGGPEISQGTPVQEVCKLHEALDRSLLNALLTDPKAGQGRSGESSKSYTRRSEAIDSNWD